MSDHEVLVVGAGPVGLTAAVELRRRGISCRIVDALPESVQYAKAVGIQPRTLEVFENMGVLAPVLNAAIALRGQIVYVNGVEQGQIVFVVPEDVPYGFLGLPQYSTERILTERLHVLGCTVERETRLVSFVQDDDGVTATLAGPSGEETVRASYIVGCDGAHSTVRRTLGLSFEGAAFAEQYMLGDVEVDWNLPRGWAIRSMHVTDGDTDDVLVCIPLPGRNRYRMSMLVPDDLATGPVSADVVQHGFEGDRKPELHHIQAVLDRLSPEPTRASSLRWSSVFRISHRIVDSYGRGRAFVAGDAAHIHPPTGAQGMNTGIQDAHNLAWKLALAVQGVAAEGLTETYDTERRPVGEEVVDRTVRDAREGIGAGETDPDYVVRREAQLLIDYAGSSLTGGERDGSGLAAGARAPDARGLTRDAVSFPVRVFSLLAGTNHTLLLYAHATPSVEDAELLETLAATAEAATHGRLTTYLIAAPDADVDATTLPVVRDTERQFAHAYGADGPGMFVIRPDGYLGYRRDAFDQAGIAAYFTSTFG